MCSNVKFRLSPTSTLLLRGILVSVLLTLPVLAYVSPPDPTWIAGLWDDADYDDVVILITSTSGIADANPFVEIFNRSPLRRHRSVTLALHQPPRFLPQLNVRGAGSSGSGTVPPPSPAVCVSAGVP